MVTTEDDLLAVARHVFGAASGWHLGVVRQDSGWTLTADHPASNGRVVETATLDPGLAAERMERMIDRHEIRVAGAAPDLVHPDTIVAVRAQTIAYDWSNPEVRGVA